VLFIIWGTRKIHDWFPVVKTDQLPAERSWLRARLRQVAMHLAVPLMATLGTGPLIAHYFGHLSLAGFVANPLVVPLVGFAVVPLGLVLGFLAVVAPETGYWLAHVTEYVVALTIGLVDLLARLPLADIGVPAPNAWEIAALYGLLICLLALKRRRHRVAVLSLGVLLLAADASFWWMERYRRSELRVTHLNVGQGDAAVVELPDGQTLLIDSGGTATGEFDTGESIVAPFLRSRKILKVEYLMVSHPRIDHYGGMRAIVEEFSPEEFWSGSARGQTTRFDDLDMAVKIANLGRLELNDRQPCREIGAVKFCVLYPPASGSAEGSVVMRLEFGQLRYLFTGDIERRDEALLVGRPEDIRSAVIKVPRHGSATASTKEFIGAVGPRLAIVSAGERSRAEVQREEVAERYRQADSEILRTYVDGAIIVQSDGRRVRYLGYKSGKGGEIDLAAMAEK
jgi:competence protein ComEC